jgi:hypothetical protein
MPSAPPFSCPGHSSVEEAKHQADYEYGSALDAWMVVPEEIIDAREFAIRVI